MKESRKIGPVLNPPPHMKKSAMKRLIADSPCLPFLLCHRSILRGHPCQTNAAASLALMSMAEFLALYRPVPWAPAKRSHIRLTTRLISRIQKVFNLRAFALHSLENHPALNLCSGPF
jgi:hypothetical protein